MICQKFGSFMFKSIFICGGQANRQSAAPSKKVEGTPTQSSPLKGARTVDPNRPDQIRRASLDNFERNIQQLGVQYLEELSLMKKTLPPNELLEIYLTKVRRLGGLIDLGETTDVESEAKSPE